MKNNENNFYAKVLNGMREDRTRATSDEVTIEDIEALAKALDVVVIATKGQQITVAVNYRVMVFDAEGQFAVIAVLKKGKERASVKKNWSDLNDVSLIIENVIAEEEQRINEDIKECSALLKSEGIPHTIDRNTGMVLMLQYKDLVVAINHKLLNYTYHDPTADKDLTDIAEEYKYNKMFELFNWKSIPEIKRLTFFTL